MNEPVEQLIREMVARTGEPFLFRPPTAVFKLFAIPLRWIDHAPEDTLALFCAPTPSDDDAWADAMAFAYHAVREWLPGSVEGVVLNTDERRCECSVLGLSLLQLALNRTDAHLALHLWHDCA